MSSALERRAVVAGLRMILVEFERRRGGGKGGREGGRETVSMRFRRDRGNGTADRTEREGEQKSRGWE